MLSVTFVAPFFTDNARAFLQQIIQEPDVRLALVTQEPADRLDAGVKDRLSAYVQVANALDAGDIGAAARDLTTRLGPTERLLGVVEQLQVPLAQVREELGIPGMRVPEAHNFRDKTRMKELLGAAGLPVARHKLVKTTAEALSFAAEVGYPLVVKPPAGAASQTTYRARDEAGLRAALTPASIAADGVVLLEELVVGEEHSFDAFMRKGELVFHSTTNYRPTPLEVMESPWMQWVVVSPREPGPEDVVEAGARALRVLGLETGMCHLEWFRRPDGSLVISEVAARPPGAQIVTMISRAHGTNCLRAWIRLMLFEEFEAFPARTRAAGAAYLRGQGEGRVRAVHGLDVIDREVGHLVTDKSIPKPNQEKAKSYEGEGYILVAHPETAVVEEALQKIISTVRVELA